MAERPPKGKSFEDLKERSIYGVPLDKIRQRDAEGIQDPQEREAADAKWDTFVEELEERFGEPESSGEEEPVIAEPDIEQVREKLGKLGKGESGEQSEPTEVQVETARSNLEKLKEKIYENPYEDPTVIEYLNEVTPVLDELEGVPEGSEEFIRKHGKGAQIDDEFIQKYPEKAAAYRDRIELINEALSRAEKRKQEKGEAISPISKGQEVLSPKDIELQRQFEEANGLRTVRERLGLENGEETENVPSVHNEDAELEAEEIPVTPLQDEHEVQPGRGRGDGAPPLRIGPWGARAHAGDSKFPWWLAAIPGAYGVYEVMKHWGTQILGWGIFDGMVAGTIWRFFFEGGLVSETKKFFSDLTGANLGEGKPKQKRQAASAQASAGGDHGHGGH